jgi:hypothetical protein
MAHFAQLDTDNKVIQVIIISNDVTHNKDNVEQEELGIAFCQSLFGEDTKWVQTSFNSNTRKKFAGINDFYDAQIDAFIPYQPYPSWTFDNTEWHWKAPTLYPTDNGKAHNWNEETLSWVEEVSLAIE